MTEKKHHPHKAEHEAGAPPATPPAEGIDPSGTESAAQPGAAHAQVQDLQAQLAAAEAKAAENLDGWQRAVAEFQNFKKRIERDREADQAAMKSDLILKFLPVLDDLQRALQNRPAEDAWFNGVELIERKLRAILEAEGVKRMEVEGVLFDPSFHEAISQEPVDGAESGRIVGVLQHGYMLGERVLRPAQVRVAA